MLVILTGTSFSGKSTMQSMLLENVANTRVFQTSTTRQKREYERDMATWQLPYHFYSKEEFEERIRKKEFFEYELIHKGDHDDYYGTRKGDIEQAIKDKNTIFVAVLEPHGAEKIKKAYNNAYVIFIQPPSLETIRERALKRNTETLEDISARLERAVMELTYKDQFDDCIVNHDVDDTFNALTLSIKNKNFN